MIVETKIAEPENLAATPQRSNPWPERFRLIAQLGGLAAGIVCLVCLIVSTALRFH